MTLPLSFSPTGIYPYSSTFRNTRVTPVRPVMPRYSRSIDDWRRYGLLRDDVLAQAVLWQVGEELLKQLVAEFGDCASYNSDTALHIAARHNYLAYFEIIGEAYPENLYLKNFEGETPYTIALKKGDEWLRAVGKIEEKLAANRKLLKEVDEVHKDNARSGEYYGNVTDASIAVSSAKSPRARTEALLKLGRIQDKERTVADLQRWSIWDLRCHTLKGLIIIRV